MAFESFTRHLPTKKPASEQARAWVANMNPIVRAYWQDEVERDCETSMGWLKQRCAEYDVDYTEVVKALRDAQ